MKIIKAYKHDYIAKEYGPESPLLREIRNRYDFTELVLPADYTDAQYAEILRGYDVAMTMWGSPPIPDELADNPGKLRYICNITGEMTRWISPKIIESPHFTVTNWGDAPAFVVAEGAFALLMAVMKKIPDHIRNSRSEAVEYADYADMVSLYGKRVGIYGLGVIGRKFLDFLRPFEPRILVYDPYASDLPADVTQVDSLDELFERSQIVVIHAGLTEETKGSVGAAQLAKLPDGGIVINTARGLIVDADAMRAELVSGRLRAGLDMFGGKNMPAPDDPVRNLDNVILTAHRVGSDGWGVDPDMLNIAARYCLENLARFEAGEPLKFVMTPERYRRST